MPTLILNTSKKFTKQEIFDIGLATGTTLKIETPSASWLGFKRACVAHGEQGGKKVKKHAIACLKVGIRTLNGEIAGASENYAKRLKTRRKGYENAIKDLSPKAKKSPAKAPVKESKKAPRRPVQKADSKPNQGKVESNADMVALLAAQMQTLQSMMDRLSK